MKKQPERTARTRQNLIDSFWQLYTEKRIEKITIKEIADGAGVYRSTFYEYFADVYDVLEVVENELTAAFRSAIDDAFSQSDLDDAKNRILEFYGEYGEKLAVLFGPGGDQKFYRNIKGIAKNILTDKFQLDHIDPKIDICITIISSSVIAILEYWYENRDTVSLQEIMFIASQVLQHGLMPIARELGVEFAG